MSENIEKLKGYLQNLNTQKSEYREKIPGAVLKLYGKGSKTEKPPQLFNESSFLYIRSFNQDNGSRPFQGIKHWCSPDINISPNSLQGENTTELMAGQTYNINCRLHNRGDLSIPFPKIEFFITTPSLGFDTRFAHFLGHTQLSGILLSGRTGTVDFPYNVPTSEAGHKCLFARTFSFSPLDKPIDLHTLNPRIDRHIGQKNLNIIPQNSTYQFNLIHLPNSIDRITFQPLSQTETMAMQHPGFNYFRIVPRISKDLLQHIPIEIIGKRNSKIEIKKAKQGFEITSRGEGMEMDDQARFMKKFLYVLDEIDAGRTRRSSHKELFKAYHEMNLPMQMTSFQIKIPYLNLERGDAAGLDIVNTNLVTGEKKGGISLLITG